MARKLDAQAIANITKRMLAVPQEVKKAAEVELERTANLMADGMRRDVRAYAYDEGDLYDSIKVVRADDGTGQIVYRVQAGGPTTTTAIGTRTYDSEVRIGSGDTSGRKKKAGGHRVTFDYAAAIEYGTQDSPPKPFFWPNYRQNRRRVRAALTKVMRKAAKGLS